MRKNSTEFTNFKRTMSKVDIKKNKKKVSDIAKKSEVQKSHGSKKAAKAA